jgi:hypothetical protein
MNENKAQEQFIPAQLIANQPLFIAKSIKEVKISGDE